MLLTVMPHEPNIFTIQKACFSQWLLHQSEDSRNLTDGGRFALIQLTPAISCVCKLFCRREIHPSFVYLDVSVLHTEGVENGQLPRISLEVKDNQICHEKIEFLSQLTLINHLSLTVVFEDIHALQKWKNMTEKLKPIVCEILKLFILTHNCVVPLKNLTESLRHGIHAIVVHSSNHCINRIEPGQVTSNTTIETVKIASKLRFLQLQEYDLVPKVGGLDEIATILLNTLKSNLFHRNSDNQFSLRPTKQVLLTGPPGCGKTSLVKQVVAECNATLLVVLGPEIISSKPGATEEALKTVFKNAATLADEDENAVCVLLLDEVDSLCTRRDLHRTSTHSVRATVQLLSSLEQADKVPGLIIIATTNKPHLIDPAIRRPGRLEREVHIGVPTEANRESILHLLIEPMEPPDCDSLAKQVASLTPGYVGADLTLLCQEVSLLHHQRKNSEAENNISKEMPMEAWIADFKKCIHKIKPSMLRSGLGVVLTRPTSMDSIGGLDGIKQELRVAVEWPLTHPDAFTFMGIPQPKGVLLYGPPGCAKTSLARAIAAETNTTFLAVSAADLYSPYVGEAERNITELFRRARAGAPTILFIDEIDALVGSRGDSERGVNECILSTLLTEMDGVGIRLDDIASLKGTNSGSPDSIETSRKTSVTGGVIVVAATNRPDNLDDAILRPGRLDKLLYIPAPKTKERLDILTRVTSSMPLAECVNLSYLAEKTKLYSGADLSQLSKEAALHALTEGGMTTNLIRQSHFETALKNYRPSLSEQQLNWYDNYAGRKSTSP